MRLVVLQPSQMERLPMIVRAALPSTHDAYTFGFAERLRDYFHCVELPAHIAYEASGRLIVRSEEQNVKPVEYDPLYDTDDWLKPYVGTKDV